MLPNFKLAENLVQISDLEHCVSWIPYGRTKIQNTLMIKTSNEEKRTYRQILNRHHIRGIIQILLWLQEGVSEVKEPET